MIERRLSAICGTPLWNQSLVYSPFPDFTFCFHYTLLVWLPCMIVWLVAPFWLLMLARKKRDPIKISWLISCRTLFQLILIKIQVVHLYMAWNTHEFMVYFLTPSLLIATLTLVLFVTHYERLRGWRLSTFLFTFWFVLAFSYSLTLRTKIFFNFNKDHTENAFGYELTQMDIQLNKLSDREILLFYAEYAVVVINFFLSFFSEKALSKSPKLKCSVMSHLFFDWVNSLLSTGSKRPLTADDFWALEKNESSEYLTKKLESEWNSLASEYIRNNRNSAREEKPKERSKKSNSKGAHKEEGSVQEKSKLNEGHNLRDNSGPKKLKPPSLALCIFKTVSGKYFSALLIFFIVHVVLHFTEPLLLDLLINFMHDKEQNVQVGLFYVVLMATFSIVRTVMGNLYHQQTIMSGHSMKTSLTNIIYKKSFRLSASARQTTTVGEMTNLITTDSAVFVAFFFYLNFVLMLPIKLGIATYFLYTKLGMGTFAGMAIVILFVPVNGFITNSNRKVGRKREKLRDKRVKLMNEILSGIRVIRFYGWETSFQKIVKDLHSKEIKYRLKIFIGDMFLELVWMIVPYSVTCMAFVVFLLTNEASNMTADKAFVSLILLAIIRNHFNFIPHFLQMLVKVNIALNRISKFLLLEEVNEDDLTHIEKSDSVIEIKNLDLGWSKESVTLKNINLKIEESKLVAIVGNVGSGKSSLLSALLGDMEKLNNGELNIHGSIAYVPQQAWVQNATIRNNIIFNTPYVKSLYDRVIKACNLSVDLSMLADYDQTEIGEKGINLSGGQKQRLSLARSVYSKADIYLLDDPLSAVDSHVGKSIFDEVIGPKGMLKKKTRVFVTNSLSFLPKVDHIVFVEDGHISGQGTYTQLSEENESFANFMKSFLDTKEANQEAFGSFSSASARRKKFAEQCSVLTQRSIDRQFSMEGSEQIEDLADTVASYSNKLIEDEKIETGRVKLAHFFNYLKECRLWLCSFYLIFVLAKYAFINLSNFWLSAWSNEAESNPDAALENKFYRISIYTLLGVAQGFIVFAASVTFVFMVIKATTILHARLLASVLRSKLTFFESTPIGRILNRFTKDIEATEAPIAQSTKDMIDMVIEFTAMIIVISLLTPWFLVSLVPVILVYFFIRKYFLKSFRQIKRVQSNARSPIFSHFAETQSGVCTIKAYNVQDKFIQMMQNKIDSCLACDYAFEYSHRWLSLRLVIVGNMITVFASLFAIFARSTLTSGLAALSISTSMSMSGILHRFVSCSADFEVNITSLERLDEYFKNEPEGEWEIASKKPDKSWPDKGHVTFENYAVKYREDLNYTLNNLNVEIKPGEKIGIVGRTGAGKSSLTLGLFRMIEYIEGTLTIDNVDIKQIGLHDLRQRLTIIPQDPVIFSGTIKMNLDPFEIHSDREIWLALELAHLKEFITGLDGGLMFECSEGGENLSVGQRQLICLARALLRKTKILVLDEATASVDHNTDDLIQTTIRAEFADCTVFTIAHRLNTIMDSSRIMVLDQGQIVEFDSPRNLLSKQTGKFYKMAKEAGIV